MIYRNLILESESVRLEPLHPRHAAALFPLADDATLRYLNLWAPVESEGAMADQLTRIIADGDTHFFAVVDKGTNQAVGSTSYLDLRPAHRGLEIGNTWLGESARSTRVNPEMKHLMLEYAFGSLGCLRVQLKTDARNLRSQAALRKLGAVYEGTLRKHMICRDGFVRDTVMFSITDEEWPSLRAALEARLTRF